MKRTIFSLLLACGVFSSTSICAESRSDRGQKVYVQPEQITLQNDYILVNLSQGQFRAPNLRTDDQGYFVYSNELLTAKVQVEQCPCGFSGVGSEVSDRSNPRHQAHREMLHHDSHSCESRHGHHGGRHGKHR